ncbi:MAG: ABC transporter ATP-binding protein [Pseudomonadota bacterium]
MLSLLSVSTSYGKVQVLNQVSMEVRTQQIVTLLGANGAGKTTAMRTITGLLTPTEGTIEFEGRKIGRLSPHRIVRMGISMVPEGRLIFPLMTVYQNLEMGAFIRGDLKGVRRDLERIYQYFPVLKNRKSQVSATLSGGEQQMLVIGRALMSRPKLLLLDEPSLGLAPTIARAIFKIITTVNVEEERTIFLVEQNARMALSISHYGYIMEVGRVVLAGESGQLQKNDEVIKAYLGE